MKLMQRRRLGKGVERKSRRPRRPPDPADGAYGYHGGGVIGDGAGEIEEEGVDPGLEGDNGAAGESGRGGEIGVGEAGDSDGRA